MEIQKVKETLIQQKKMNLSGSLFERTQLLFSYHTNAIEGSTITEDETEQLYTTGTIITNGEKAIIISDAKETQNHFEVFKYILDTIDQPLSEQLIKKIHYILKEGTLTEEEKDWFNLGDYKTRVNAIGVFDKWKTTAPKDVPKEMEKLLSDYNSKTTKSIEDIIDFHVEFESIHPFSDGNGRVGRAVMFRECLYNDIMPFIIELRNKPFYMKGIKEYRFGEKERLIETCLNSQDNYKEMCEIFLKKETDRDVGDNVES